MSLKCFRHPSGSCLCPLQRWLCPVTGGSAPQELLCHGGNALERCFCHSPSGTVLRNPPKLLWDWSQKSELWSGSCKPAGESCSDPVVLADIAFQISWIPKVSRYISSDINYKYFSLPQDKSSAPSVGRAGQGQTCPTGAALVWELSPTALGRGSSRAGGHRMWSPIGGTVLCRKPKGFAVAEAHPWGEHAPGMQERLPEWCRSHLYPTREDSRLPCQQGHVRRALWHPHF